MKRSKVIIFLILVIILAFGLRVYKVTEDPPSLNWDEVSIGYNAYSILKTGRDEWNQLLPIHFKAYGEYKLPVQIYSSVPGIAIFGLNELGVRITPVIYGTLTILLIFLLATELFKNRWIGLISALLLAISPWHLQLTRASFESATSVFWILLGLWLIVKGFKDKKWFPWSVIPFAVSIYTYNSARVFTPLFLGVIAIIYRRFFLSIKKTFIVSGLVFLVLMLPLLPFFLSPDRNSRYKLVSVTDDPGLIPRINENRGHSSLPQPLPLLVHNKYTYVSFYVAEHYLAHFTPDFLFLNGAPHKQHHVQGIGELYLFQAPFLLLGLYLLIKRKERLGGLLFSWILLSIVPVSVTNDSIPHALRTLIAAPFYQIITALGIYEFFNLLKKRYPRLVLSALLILLIIVGISFAGYLNNYYNSYPQKYSKDWQYGYKEAVHYIQENMKNYDLIVFTRSYGEPQMFTLFYLNYNPSSFQNDSNLVRFETFDWVRVLRFNKFYFPDLGDEGTRYQDIISQNPHKKILFIGKPGDFPPQIPNLKTIYFLNSEPAFEIVSSNG